MKRSSSHFGAASYSISLDKVRRSLSTCTGRHFAAGSIVSFLVSLVIGPQEQSTRNGGHTNTSGYDAAFNPTTWKENFQSFNNGNQNNAYSYDGNGNPTTYNGTPSPGPSRTG